MLFFGFFFSSRRRHTRWTGDWSSDVCSSDLAQTADGPRAGSRPRPGRDPAAAVGLRARNALWRDHLSRDTSQGGGARAPRSEERRVGKEWRSRWSPEHEKKKG